MLTRISGGGVIGGGGTFGMSFGGGGGGSGGGGCSSTSNVLRSWTDFLITLYASPVTIAYISPPTTTTVKMIDIVRSEKQLEDDKLTPETALADAGIDSLDALTILFAIEEQFGISIPDDKARSMKTFGDMIDVVAELKIKIEKP